MLWRGGAFRDEGVAVVADDVEVVSFGFAHELPEHDVGSERGRHATGLLAPCDPAAALGIEVPATLLARADEVIS